MAHIKLEKIEIEELSRGIKLILENAEQLINEGDLLYSNKYFSRAYTLYQLAIEEIGKAKLLFGLIMDLRLEREVNFDEINKQFLDHKAKSKSAITSEIIALLLLHSSGSDGSSDERKNEFFEALEPLKEESGNMVQINNYKNDSLYVGVQDNTFIAPKNIITDEMVSELRTSGIIRLKASISMFDLLLDDMDNIVKVVKEYESIGKPQEPDHDFFAGFFQ